ncbi:MAG: magnesium transporter [Rhodothermales bacterium]|nr:magnesium transporter [Rhodothermales bacterium]MBO6779621.1 magnesium transporter [Rhodothermales bacterium]
MEPSDSTAQDPVRPAATVEPESVRATATVELDPELLDDLEALIEAGSRPMLMNILADMHPADIGGLLEHLSRPDARTVLGWLPTELAGDAIVELDDDYRADLLEDVSPSRLTAVLDEMDTDDAADVLSDLPEEIAEVVLPRLEDSEDIGALMGYDEETAGGLMATEFVAVPTTWTVAEATEEVRRNAEEVEQVYGVWAVDPDGKLQGFVSMKRMLLSPSEARIEKVMNPDPVSVETDMDQEEVARLMERYDLVTLPVIDGNGCLVGRITIDDIVDVIREEAEEDIQRMSGVAGGEEATDSVMRVVRGRLPWLLAGMLGAGLAAAVILQFEDALAASAILAGFIPIVMATAGNAGIQSSAIAVQALAAGDIWAADLMPRIGKEITVSLLNGVASAVVLGLVIMGVAASGVMDIEDPMQLAMTAAVALVIVIVMATTIGATIPLFLNRAGIDPALATGPFITTSNDILGILVFFLLAEALYL